MLARLVAVGDARVAAAVYRNPRTTQSLRRTIAERLDAVPLDSALRAELTAPHGEVPRTWLAPLLGSGDPHLVVPALRCGVRQAAQRYALLRIWERTGPDAVRALLDDPAAAAWLSRATVDTVTEALAAPDGDGPRRLRAQGEPYEDPARLPALLATARGTSTLRDLLSEPYVHDLDALAAAHAATPFMPKACEELARHEAASDAQRQAFRLCVLNEPWRAGAAVRETPPAHSAPRPGGARRQRRRLGGGHGNGGVPRPGRTDRHRAPRRPCPRRARPPRRTGPAGHGGGRRTAGTDTGAPGERERAWAALDVLLPEHAGTVAELIAKAGKVPDQAATEPRPPAPPAEHAAESQPRAERVAESDPPAEHAAEPESVADSGPPAEHLSPFREPSSRRTLHRRDRVHALAALDLLYSLAPDGAPRPKDPEVLRALADYEPRPRPASPPLAGSPSPAPSTASPVRGWFRVRGAHPRAGARTTPGDIRIRRTAHRTRLRTGRAARRRIAHPAARPASAPAAPRLAATGVRRRVAGRARPSAARRTRHRPRRLAPPGRDRDGVRSRR
ncbi:hypothetical protein ACFQ3Z_42755 [Streptomyces nogalater]